MAARDPAKVERQHICQPLTKSGKKIIDIRNGGAKGPVRYKVQSKVATKLLPNSRFLLPVQVESSILVSPPQNFAILKGLNELPPQIPTRY